MLLMHATNSIISTCLDAGIEPFDEDLSRKLQVLNDQANTLTTEVIAHRKALPARRAQAMERRAAVIRALEARKEEQRRVAEKQHAQKLREQSKPIAVDLKRKAEVADTLTQSVVDITSLQVVSAASSDPCPKTETIRVSDADHTSLYITVTLHYSVLRIISNSLSSSKQLQPTNKPSWSSVFGPCQRSEPPSLNSIPQPVIHAYKAVFCHLQSCPPIPFQMNPSVYMHLCVCVRMP